MNPRELEQTSTAGAAEQERTLAPQDLLRLLTDGYALNILAATNKTPLSVQALAQQQGIPVAVAYRRVNALVDAGLLDVADRPVNESHRRTWIYQSRVKGIHITYTPESGVSVNVIFAGQLTADRYIGLDELVAKRTRLELPSSTGQP